MKMKWKLGLLFMLVPVQLSAGTGVPGRRRDDNRRDIARSRSSVPGGRGDISFCLGRNPHRLGVNYLNIIDFMRPDLPLITHWFQ